MTDILEFKGENAYLSNFFYAPFIAKAWLDPGAGERIAIYPSTWPTVEHFFQACKSSNVAGAERVLNAGTPGQAKRFGRTLDLRQDWEEIKDKVMEEGVWRKFHSHPRLAELLASTDDSVLVEGNRWGDKYWGACFEFDSGQESWSSDGRLALVGKNRLGEILMSLRTRLQDGRRTSER